MSNEPCIDLSIDKRELLKSLPEPQRTRISANFTANKLMGRKEALHFFEIDRIYPHQDSTINTKEELAAFLNKGGEGIDLTFEEACMIYGIANIFTEYDYPDYVECTEKQLIKAMRYDKNLSGWQRQRFRGMLEDLSKKRFPIYWNYDGDWRCLTFDTLIKLAWGVRSRDGCEEFKTLPTRENFTRYKIAFNKGLVEKIGRNFRLGDPNIGKEIREHRKRKGERPSKYDIRFYYLLLGENREIIKRNYLKTAQAPMLMDHYIRGRKFKLIRAKLNSIYKMYHDLGYLLSYLVEQQGSRYPIDIFRLNPEKFYKLRNG